MRSDAVNNKNKSASKCVKMANAVFPFLSYVLPTYFKFWLFTFLCSLLCSVWDIDCVEQRARRDTIIAYRRCLKTFEGMRRWVRWADLITILLQRAERYKINTIMTKYHCYMIKRSTAMVDYTTA